MHKNHSRQLLTRSCEWIREHRDTTNHDVPDDLLESWTYSNDGEQEAPSGYHLAVFIFGYMFHKIESAKVPTESRQSLFLSEAMSLFQAWQCKLALTEIHRNTELRISSSLLFEFPADEQFEVRKP